ncbi:MAG TPA: hypothetical protein VLZ83_14455 [Edaphocola sp.]|nr:hypothetical protein [Edaphocola sp.]
MKKTIMISAILGWISIGIACSPKKVVESGPASMTKAMAQENYSGDQIAKGEAIYQQKCGRCHVLHKTNEYKANKWHGILNSMIPKSKVSVEDGELIRAYVIANSK